MDTIQINEVFAEFMDLAKQRLTNENTPVYLYEHPFTGEYVSLDQLQYDNSWLWLMPVVEKIESLPQTYLVNILGKVVKILLFSVTDPILEEIVSNIGDTKKEAVYGACFKFITKFNEDDN